MTPEEIIAMAKEAGMEVHERKGQVRISSAVLTGADSTDEVTRFATLVAAKEREACAQVCDELAALNRVGAPGSATWEQEECAAAIRARGAA